MKKIGNSQLLAKRCPRCNGNLVLEYEEYRWYINCLQCGHEQNMKDMLAVLEKKQLV